MLTELIELSDDGLDVTVLGGHVSPPDGHFKRRTISTGRTLKYVRNVVCAQQDER